MRICIPINEPKGPDSEVCAHFGSAPYFMIATDEGDAHEMLVNPNRVHAQGQCQPMAALEGQTVDAIVVGGIGRGALIKLTQAGLAVYRSEEATAREALEAFKAGKLERVAPEGTCIAHGIEGCGH